MQSRLLAVNEAPNSPQASGRRRHKEQTQVRAFLAQQEAKQANVWCSGKGSESLWSMDQRRGSMAAGGPRRLVW